LKVSDEEFVSGSIQGTVPNGLEVQHNLIVVVYHFV
jgi:hypothetical protein